MNMKRIASTFLASVALGAATFATVRRLHPAPQGVRRAFTATIFEERYTQAGKLAMTEFSIHAVRSDGSQVDLYNRQDPKGGPMNWKAVVDVPARMRTVTEPVTESLVRFPLADIQVSHYLGLNHPCTIPPASPRDNILGYQVFRIERESSGPGPAYHLVDWVAPALDCFPLTHFYKAAPGDAPGPHNKREVVHISEGEPAPALFELPAGYVERSAAQADELFSQRFPGIRPFGTEAAAGEVSGPGHERR